jgi:hypothetical protein
MLPELWNKNGGKIMTREEEAILHMTLRREELKHSVSNNLDEDIKAFDMAIKALEQTRWIPVTERLPEENICEAPGPVWKRIVLITGYFYWDAKEDTFITTAFARDVRNNCVRDVNIIAWMPYPEIYKPESEEHE